MSSYLIYRVRTSNTAFQLIAIVVLICIISIANFSIAFADSH